MVEERMEEHTNGKQEPVQPGKEQHAVTIWEVNETWLDSIEQKINQAPRLLHKSAGRSSCSIFRVPQSLIDTNGKAYNPDIVSIGPYHHGKEHLKMIEEHKWRFLGSLLSRTAKVDRGLKDYLKAMGPMEARARECYSETINLDTNTFVEMMVLDGFFIIELLRKFGRLVPIDQDDPLFTMQWIFPFLMRDLLRLENQIPFFVLQCLFDLSQVPDMEKGPSLALLALEFFNSAVQRPDKIIRRYHDLDGFHLLDLVRSSFIPETKEPFRTCRTPNLKMIQSVRNLRKVGIRFKQGKADSFLDITFKHGVLEIPPITIDDFQTIAFLNLVAFEQCSRNSSMHFTTYATFLDCLIDAPKDVGFLRDSNIIENYFGTDEQVARYFNNLGKDVAFDIERSYLSKLFEEINDYYKNFWHVEWASFKHTYFNSPWSFISALAAVILLLLTIAQTFFSVYSYVQPPS